jgi:hypothetical protein
MEFQEVQLGAVAFVLAEAILRETRAEVAHNRVARHLGDHARGRDREAVAIAVDDRCLGEREGEHGQTIDQDVLRLKSEAGNRNSHRFVSRSKNIDCVDLDGIDDADRPRDRVVCDEILVNPFAFLRQKLFRIVQLFVPEFFRKDVGCGHDWTRERAATGFVNAGDAGNPKRAQFAFVTESTAPIHRRKNTETLKN